MKKKLLLFSITVFACCNMLFAQTIVDCLRNLLNAHPQEDTIRVNLLNNYVQELRRIDRAQAPPFVEEALQLAQKLNYAKGEGRALIYKALISYDKFDFQESLNNFEKAKQVLERISD